MDGKWWQSLMTLRRWLFLMDEEVTDGAVVTRQSKRMATLEEGERKNAMASGRLLKTINSDYGNDYYDWKGVKRVVHAGARESSGAAHGRANEQACARCRTRVRAVGWHDQARIMRSVDGCPGKEDTPNGWGLAVNG
jgi:hypothetical protein